MTSTRFSKATLQNDLQERIVRIQQTYGFDPDNGTAQINAITDVNEADRSAVLMAYGQFRLIESIAETYDLTVYLNPEGFGKKPFLYNGQSYTRIVRTR